MASNHLILCRPLLLLPSIFPSLRVFSNESVLRIRWPKYWSFSFSISPSNDYSGLISFRMDWCTRYPIFISTSCKFVPLNNISPVLLHVGFFFFFNMRLMYELIYALVIYNSSHPIQVPKNLRKQIVNQKITRWAWIQSEKLLNGFSRFTTSREDSSELYTVLCAGHCFLSQEFLETWRDMCICSSFYEQCLFMTLLHFLLVVHLSCVGKASFVFVYNFFPICLLLSYLQ